MKRAHWTLGSGAVAAGRDILGPVTIQMLPAGAPDALAEAIFDPRPLYETLDLRNFVGREWLVDEIDRYILTHRRGYVLLQAEAGVGKSAFAAHLVWHRGAVHHFTRLDGGRSPEAARRSLGAQLIARWELSNLAPEGILPVSSQEPRWLLRVLEAVAAKRDEVAAGSAVVLIIDGLDEADLSVRGADTGVPLGLPSPDYLPQGVFIIATSRFGPPVPALQGDPESWHTIAVEGADNRADLRRYLSSALQDGGPSADRALKAAMTSAGVDRQWFVAELDNRCAGVWIYLRYVLDDIRAGRRSPNDVETLPFGLLGYYSQQMAKWRREPSWRHEGLPILATLVAVQTSLDEKTLYSFAMVPDGAKDPSGERDVWLRERFRAFLEVSGPTAGNVRVRHQSLKDFFETDPTDLSPAASILREANQALLDAHARIVAVVVPPGDRDARDWSKISEYARSVLADHASACGAIGDLLDDPGFLQVVDPPSLLRQRATLRDLAEQSALNAYELTSHSLTLANLNLWAARTRATNLSLTAGRKSRSSWVVHSAFWRGRTHRPAVFEGDLICDVSLMTMTDERVILAVAGRDTTENGIVAVFDPASGQRLQSWSLEGRGAAVAVCGVENIAGVSLIAVATDDKVITLWDPLTGTQVGRPMHSHFARITSLCSVHDPTDGRAILASSSLDSSICLWDPETCTLLKSLHDHRDGVLAIRFAPNQGTTSLVSVDGRTIRVWDSHGASIGQPTYGQFMSLCVLPSITGKSTLITRDREGTINQWDLATRRRVGAALRGGFVSAAPVSLTDGRHMLALGDVEGLIQLFDPATGEVVGDPLTGHGSTITSLSSSVDTEQHPLLVSAERASGYARVWSLAHLGLLGAPMVGHAAAVSAIAEVSSGTDQLVLATADVGGEIRSWIVHEDATWEDAGAVRAEASIRLLAPVSQEESDKLVLAIGVDGRSRIANCAAGSLEAMRLPRGSGIASWTSYRSKTVVAQSGFDGSLITWEPGAAQQSTRLQAPRDLWDVAATAVCALVIDGSLAVFAALAGGAIEVWLAGTKSTFGEGLYAHGGEITALSGLSLAGRSILISGDSSGLIKLWDVLSGQLLGEPLVHGENAVTSLCAIPDDKGHTLFASGGGDGDIKIWDPAQGLQVASLQGHEGLVTALVAVRAPSRGGALLVSGASDGSVLLWRRRSQ